MVDGETSVLEDQRPVILAVDDEAMNLELIERSLKKEFRVLTAESGESALELLKTETDVAVIVSDYLMPGMNGAEFFARTLESHPQTHRVIATGYAEVENLVCAINAGRIHHLLQKPFKGSELLEVVEPLAKTFSQSQTRRGESKVPVSLHRTGKTALPILEVLPYKDVLTGCLSHRAFQEKFQTEISGADQSKESLTLLHLDVDKFSMLNRKFGYQIGDEILRELANFLRQNAGEDSLAIARFAGEEFTILIGQKSKEESVLFAQSLCSMVSERQFGPGVSLSLSIGVCSFPEDGHTPGQMIEASKMAVTRAKLLGGSQACGYAPDLQVNNEANVGVETKTGAPRSEKLNSYHLDMPKIVHALERDRTVACVYVDLSSLRPTGEWAIQPDSGNLVALAGKVLSGMRGNLLREDSLVCRTEDADDFVCFLFRPKGDYETSTTLENLASNLAYRLRQELSKHIAPTSMEVANICVGYSRVITNGILPSHQLASRAVQEAKSCATLKGKQKKHSDKTQLQEVIVEEQLSPVYQPIVQLDSGDIFGYESLIRGPKNTDLESPGALFTIADHVKLTSELDRACFRSGLRGAVALEPIHRLFVNLLPNSFYDSSFIENEVANLLDCAELTPANIVFEVSERLAIDDFSNFRRVLASYTAMGFGVAIDDVGTRHANLETIMALRPHFIKISDVLTRGVAESPVKREMLGSLQRIAESIDAVVVAEGIETVDDLSVLCELGVRYGQGFYMARPGPAFPRMRESIKETIRGYSRPRTPVTTRNLDAAPGCDEDMGIDSGIAKLPEPADDCQATLPKIRIVDASWKPLGSAANLAAGSMLTDLQSDNLQSDNLQSDNLQSDDLQSDNDD